MPGKNLSRVEAQQRRSVVDNARYDVSLDLTTAEDTFRVVATISFDGVEGESTFIDAITKTVHRIEFNGESLDPATHADGIRIQLPSLAKHNTLVV